MNRAFGAVIIGAAALLIGFFFVLLGGLIAELVRQSFVASTDLGEVLFAVRLSLITATVSSLIALLVSIPVAYLFSRHSFPGKDFLERRSEIAAPWFSSRFSSFPSK